MEKPVEIQIFTEELWQNITAMMVGTDMTAGDVLQALDTIYSRLRRWQARERREAGPIISTASGDSMGPS